MPEAQQREVEAKFQVTSDLLPALRLPSSLLDGYTAQTKGIVTQTDTYMDTPAYDLLRHGLALRVRHNGNVYEVGIKSIQSAAKGAIQDRLDIAFPIPTRAKPFDASTWPDEIAEQLAPYLVKLDSLRPIAVVRQQRQKAHIALATAPHPFAEWSLDEVWIGTEIDTISEQDITQPEAASDSSFPTHFYELELEYLAPPQEQDDQQDNKKFDEKIDEKNNVQESETAFNTLVAQTQERLNLTPIYASKLVRALESALTQAHGNATAPTPTMQLEAASRLLLHQQLLQIMLNEQGVRAGKKDKYVHDMRVAIRRARAVFTLCADAFPVDTLTPHKKELKRLGRALGTVRDLDVALTNLRAFRSSQPEEQQQGIKTLRAELKEYRAEARADLLTLLDSKRHRKFIKKLIAFCTKPSTAPEESKIKDEKDEVEDKQTESLAIATHIQPSQVRHTMPSRILRAFEQVRAYETVLAGESLPSLETFHALRKEAKYLRYLLEFVQPLLGKPGEQLITELRALQEHLGELNDAHVEQTRLNQWADKTDDELLSKAIETRLTQVTTHLNELATTAPAQFRQFISRPNRQKLATILTRL